MAVLLPSPTVTVVYKEPSSLLVTLATEDSICKPAWRTLKEPQSASPDLQAGCHPREPSLRMRDPYLATCHPRAQTHHHRTLTTSPLRPGLRWLALRFGRFVAADSLGRDPANRITDNLHPSSSRLCHLSLRGLHPPPTLPPSGTVFAVHTYIYTATFLFLYSTRLHKPGSRASAGRSVSIWFRQPMAP